MTSSGSLLPGTTVARQQFSRKFIQIQTGRNKKTESGHVNVALGTLTCLNDSRRLIYFYCLTYAPAEISVELQVKADMRNYRGDQGQICSVKILEYIGLCVYDGS